MQQKIQSSKKAFTRKDVERVRNLAQGKSGASSESQVGYTKKRVEYKEGDIWTENRKTWTIKNGIKQTISKLDKIKKEIFMPLCCPQCNKIMKGQLDKPNYRIHKKCHACVVETEHKSMIQIQKENKKNNIFNENSQDGKWDYDNYLEKLRTKNHLTILDDVESQLLDIVNTSNTNYISEQGDIERWVGGVDKEKMKKEIKKGAQKTRKRLKKELKTYND